MSVEQREAAMRAVRDSFRPDEVLRRRELTRVEGS
jgi:hypothetical protein